MHAASQRVDVLRPRKASVGSQVEWNSSTAHCQRHTLAWIRVDALIASPGHTLMPRVFEWVARGFPLIVRRRAQTDDGHAVPLGLPLPLSGGKQRLSLTVPRSAIRELAPPPLLADAAASSPPHWHAAIDRLIGADPIVRVFGSLAWQHLTGDAYLTEQSDLDLLWQHRCPARTEALLSSIDAIEREAPMRIDGEVVANQGAAVQWRELCSGTEQVLVKSVDRVALMSRARFLREPIP
jgi:phosphoribosyl-dephospho-CoA transferase